MLHRRDQSELRNGLRGGLGSARPSRFPLLRRLGTHTYAELARKTGVSQSTLVLIATGRRESIQPRIARALDSVLEEAV